MRCLALVIALAACSSSSTTTPVEPAPVRPTPTPVVEADPVEPPPAQAAPEPPAKLADGESCTSSDACASGTCEGLGCTDDKPGRCAPAQRACTRDLRQYCGCDGKTFQASGSCPGRRYEAKAACSTAKTNRPDGAFCLAASECASQVCEGQGCTDDKPGRCMAKQRMCTQALVTYCACDGKTVTHSNGCLGVRYAKRGTGCSDG